MWKKGEDIITVNKQVVVPSFKKRFSLNEVDNGNELVISLAEEQGARRTSSKKKGGRRVKFC